MSAAPIAPERLAAILDDRAAAGLTRDGRVDVYAGFGRKEGVAVEPSSNWNWLSFGTGMLVGLVAGILAIAIPAIILVEFVL